MHLHESPRIKEGLQQLISNDRVFMSYPWDLSKWGWETYPSGFEGICRIILSQQISTKAAESLWHRFCKNIQPLTASEITGLCEEKIRLIGLSHQKFLYIHNLALHIQTGKLNFSKLNKMNEENIVRELTGYKGLGLWSARMYLIFCLQRSDVWLAEDLGIRKGLQIYLGRDERPDISEVQKAGEAFQPYRTAACLMLWKMASGKNK